ncbi:hypothetical protein LOTGIDRAFT_176528, partial [Lottia gigantea]
MDYIDMDKARKDRERAFREERRKEMKKEVEKALRKREEELRASEEIEVLEENVEQVRERRQRRVTFNVSEESVEVSGIVFQTEGEERVRGRRAGMETRRETE